MGRGDDDYLAERLTPEKIATAAFARSGPSSIIPMLIDTSRYGIGKDAMFSHTRTTGQTSDMIFGNPTTGGIDDLFLALRSMSGLLDDREWSQEEARSVSRILPFGNALPIVTILNYLTKDQPLFAPRDQ